MKLIYTHENRMLVSNVKNILENVGIPTTLKNEFAGGGSGDLSFLNTWLEVWVLHDEDYDTAMNALQNSLENSNVNEWTCRDCKEVNQASFDLCWNCQSEHKLKAE